MITCKRIELRLNCASLIDTKSQYIKITISDPSCNENAYTSEVRPPVGTRGNVLKSDLALSVLYDSL